MTENVTLAYVDGKFMKIMLPVKTTADLSDRQLDCFAPTISSKGRHSEFRSRRKSLRNRRH